MGGAGVEIASLEGISRIDRIGETGFTVLVGQRIPGFWLDTVDDAPNQLRPDLSRLTTQGLGFRVRTRGEPGGLVAAETTLLFFVQKVIVLCC